MSGQRSGLRPWKPGERPVGRAKGTPNKVDKTIKDMIVGALSQVGGQDWLAEQANQHPVAFMALVGRVLPLQLANNGDQPLVIDFRWRDPEPETVTIESETIRLLDSDD